MNEKGDAAEYRNARLEVVDIDFAIVCELERALFVVSTVCICLVDLRIFRKFTVRLLKSGQSGTNTEDSDRESSPLDF